jgi:CrcB protein
MIAYFWVAIGGALGSMGRYWMDGVVSNKFGTSFPWGVLFINIGGSFLIGIIGALASPEGRLDSQSRVFATQFLMIGICGGYTTFSSFSLRTLRFLQEGQWLYAGAYIISSVILCLIAVWLGYLLGDWFGQVPAAMTNSTKGS